MRLTHTGEDGFNLYVPTEVNFPYYLEKSSFKSLLLEFN